MLTRRLAAFLTIALAPLGLASCGVLEISAQEPKEHVIKIVSDYDNLRMYFDPKYLTIKPGDTVTWVNLAEEEHNMLTFPDGHPRGGAGFQSPLLKNKDERWSQTLPVAGTYEYHCLPHLPMGMHGVVIAGSPSRSSEFHVPTAAEVARYRRQMHEYFDEDEVPYRDRAQRAKK